MKKILAISDLHCGAVAGLLPPNYHHRDRDIKLQQNRVQEHLWDHWKLMCDSIGHVDIIICNGDIVDGCNRHSHGKDILISDIMVQCDIACQCLKMIDANKYIFTQGSGYHVNDNPSADEMICKMMNGDWYNWFGDVYVDNIVINIQHETPFSKDPGGRFNSQRKDANQLKLQGNDADIFIRSHTHYFAYSGDANSLTVTTPCWKGLDGFVSKKSQILPHNGYILFNVEGSDYSWDYYTFVTPAYFFAKHNNY
jgi:hypothetical protein